MPELHRTLRILAWAGLAGAWLWLWHQPGLSERGSSVPDGVVVQRDLTYQEGPNHRTLDLYLPAGKQASRPWPIILAVHGGSWTGGSKAHYGPQVARLAQHGYAVAVPDYHLARPGRPSWPRVADDLREAIRWLRRHAAERGMDARRIVALGSGAGGHLAALLGTDPPGPEAGGESARVQAVVDLYGPADLSTLLAARGLENDPIRTLIGGASPDRLAAASPLAHVSPDDPPVLMVHGLDDLWVPPDQSRALAVRLSRAGVPHRLILIPGARHGFELMLGAPSRRDLVPDLLSFLEGVWRSGTPPS